MKIDTAYLAELSKLSFRIKKKIFEKYAGDEVTKDTGDGLTFKDHSAYNVGDDVRKIDWKAYARTGELYVKRYVADRNLTLHVIIDASASMNFGKTDDNKFSHASKIAIALSYIFGRHHNRVRFATFAEKLHTAKTLSGTATLQGMLHTLESTQLTGKTDLIHSLIEYKQKSLKGKASVVLFSDFLSPIEEIQQIINILGRSHAVLVHIVHPEEEHIKLLGDFKITDAELGDQMHVHISPRFVNEYKTMFQSHVDQIKDLAQKRGVQYIQLNTGEQFVDNFMRVWELL